MTSMLGRLWKHMFQGSTTLGEEGGSPSLLEKKLQAPLRNEQVYRMIKEVIPNFAWERCGESGVVFKYYPTIGGHPVPLKEMVRYCTALREGRDAPFLLDTLEEQKAFVEEKKARHRRRRAMRRVSRRAYRLWGGSHREALS